MCVERIDLRIELSVQLLERYLCGPLRESGALGRNSKACAGQDKGAKSTTGNKCKGAGRQDIHDESLSSGKLFKATDFLYLGRGVHFPMALEGALKLKEISYIHAEGYPAGEMKHGPNALIDESLPVVILATKDGTAASSVQYEKTLSNMQEVKAREGRVLAIVTEGDTEARKVADYVIEIPQAPDLLTSILEIVPLQLLAYHIAVRRGCDVDQPRNLAKSVTVE